MAFTCLLDLLHKEKKLIQEGKEYERMCTLHQREEAECFPDQTQCLDFDIQRCKNNIGRLDTRLEEIENELRNTRIAIADYMEMLDMIRNA